MAAADGMEVCLVCEKKFRGEDAMKSHLLEAHAKKVAEVIGRDKWRNDPILPWISQFLQPPDEMRNSRKRKMSSLEADSSIHSSRRSTTRDRSATPASKQSCNEREDGISTIAASTSSVADAPFVKCLLCAEMISHAEHLQRTHVIDIHLKSVMHKPMDRDAAICTLLTDCFPCAEQKSEGRLCGMCGTLLTPHEWVEHAKIKHPIRRHVYKCSLCTYWALGSQKRVVEHINTVHGTSNAIVERDTTAEFSKLLEQCFGMDSVTITQRLVSVTGQQFEASGQCAICGLRVPLLDAVIRQHVYRLHVDRPLFRCSELDCSYTNNYRAWPVRQHIALCQHSEGSHANATVSNDIHRFLPEIRRLMLECALQPLPRSKQ